MKRYLEDEQGPVTGLQQLPRERLPERDLWAAIEQRLQSAPAARPRRSAGWPYALAASVCLAVLVAGLVRMPQTVKPDAVVAATGTDELSDEPAEPSTNRSTPYSNRDGQPTDAPTLSARTLHTLRSESLDNAPAMVAQRAESGGLMKANLARGSRSHSQEALLRANLKLVSQAEREVRRALKQDPESEALLSLLEAAEGKRALLTAMLVHEPD